MCKVLFIDELLCTVLYKNIYTFLGNPFIVTFYQVYYNIIHKYCNSTIIHKSSRLACAVDPHDGSSMCLDVHEPCARCSCILSPIIIIKGLLSSISILLIHTQCDESLDVTMYLISDY